MTVVPPEIFVLFTTLNNDFTLPMSFMNFSRYLSVAFLLLGLELLPCVFAQNKNVSELPGREEDFPEEIVNSGTKDIFKFNGTEIVTRDGNEPDKCKTACQAEASINCQYYRYITKTDTCLLFSSKLEFTGQSNASAKPTNKEYPVGDEGVAGEEDPGDDYPGDEYPAGDKGGAGGQGEDLNMDSIKKQELMQEIKELEDEQEMTNTTIQKINGKVGKVDENNIELKNEIAEVVRHDKKTSKELKTISKKEYEIERKLEDITISLQNLGTDVVRIKVSNNKIKDDLDHSETKSPVLDRQLMTIRREIADLKSKVEMNPTVFKITKNQRVLAEALESIDRELTIFERKLGHIDDISDEMAGRLTKEELHRKTLNGALQTLTAAVRLIRKDIDKLENPLSELNVKRDNVAKAIKSDVNVLVKNNKKLNHDTSKMKSELNNLLKDLLVVQQGNQEGKTSVAALTETNRNMRQDFIQIRQDQEHMMGRIQTLATVYRSVLTALHNMEIKQIQVVHRIKQYEQSLHRLSRDFLGKKMQIGSGSSKTPMMLSNLTSYSNLLLSQRNLYSQMLSLQNEVRALKGEPAPTSKPPTTTAATNAGLVKPTVKRGRLNLVKRLKPVHNLNSEMKDKQEESRRKENEDYDDDDNNENDYQRQRKRSPPTPAHTSQPKVGVLNAKAINPEKLGAILEDNGQPERKYEINFSGNKATLQEDNTPES